MIEVLGARKTYAVGNGRRPVLALDSVDLTVRTSEFIWVDARQLRRIEVFSSKC